MQELVKVLYLRRHVRAQPSATKLASLGRLLGNWWELRHN